MNTEKIWEKDGFLLRPAKAEDAEAYFEQNYNPLEKEVARMTGCKEVFSREEVVSFFQKAVADDDYCFFLLIAPDGRIVGESVINEIDWEVRSANFRIAIFHQEERGRGIGRWMVEKTRDYAFEKLKLHRLDLDVYSFNERAARLYKSVGFHQEGILRDAVLDGDSYADDILLAMLEEEWRRLKEETER